MSLDVVKKTVEFTQHFGGSIVIGGGEPTLHPQFWEILGIVIGGVSHTDFAPWMATNGSITPIALRLAEIAKTGVIAVALSQDQWHDPIDPKVIKAFRVNYGDRKYDDRRDINDVKIPTNHGRAKRLRRVRYECACEGLFVKPNGDIFQCGCEGSPKTGDIFAAIDDEKYNSFLAMEGICYKKFIKAETEEKEQKELEPA